MLAFQVIDSRLALRDRVVTRLAVLRPMASSLIAGTPPQRSMSQLDCQPPRLECCVPGWVFSLLLDHRAQFGIERGAVGQVEDARPAWRTARTTWKSSLMSPLYPGGCDRAASAAAARSRARRSMPSRSRSMPAQAIMAPLSVQSLIGGATRRTAEAPSSRPRR